MKNVKRKNGCVQCGVGTEDMGKIKIRGLDGRKKKTNMSYLQDN